MILPETVLRDVRYGLRVMTRNPGTTSVTVLALALGIGVATAVFTGFKALIARPLDARDPAAMVNIALRRDTGTPQFSFSYPDYEALRASLTCFNGLIAYRPAQLVYSDLAGRRTSHAPLTGSALGRLGLLRQSVGSAEFATVFVVSENYFKVLGVRMLQGRGFDSIPPAELSSNPPVLVSENYWQRRFAGDRSIIGKIVHLNGIAMTIAGITPHDFGGTGIGAPAFWMPIAAEPLVAHADRQWLWNRENQPYRLFGRLASGVRIGQAQAQVNLAAEHLRSLHDPHSDWAKPATALVWPGSPFPLPLTQYRGLMLSILLIMAAAGMVLVVACANVGSLQLARARSRESEFRARMSLGASRVRLIRQLVTESALLGAIAGGIALLFTWMILKAAVMAMANAVPGEYGSLVFDVTPDLQIFAFVAAISCLAGMLSGLAPAMEISGPRLISNAGRSTSPAGSRRLQDALVAAQVALSLVLMIAGSMAIRSSIRAVSIDTGYENKRVFALEVQFPESIKYSSPQKRLFIEELRTRISALPGVAIVTNARPPGDAGFRTPVTAPQGSRNVQSSVHYVYVQPGYFETLGIPLTLGRGLPERAGRSVILSESAAQDLWPGENPVGRILNLGSTDERFHNPSEHAATGAAYQVVGVARDTRAVEFGATDSRRVYLPMPDDRASSYPLLVRTRSAPSSAIASLDSVFSSIDPNVMAICSTLEEMQHQSAPFIAASLGAMIASSIGMVGLLLALMGIYGTVSYIVVLRTREVGIRVAVGAQKRHVLRLILRESLMPVLAGLMVGNALAAGASYLARGALYGLDGIDGISLAGVSLLFLVIGLLASSAPAWRATRVDPVVALRCE